MSSSTAIPASGSGNAGNAKADQTSNRVYIKSDEHGWLPAKLVSHDDANGVKDDKLRNLMRSICMVLQLGNLTFVLKTRRVPSLRAMKSWSS